MKMKIEEVIVVEGRDDIINLKQFVEAEIIATHGYGITEETIKKIRTANQKKGIIILTDPDFAGEKIRSRLGKLFPEAKHAFIAREDAMKGDNIGVENANGDVIKAALGKVRRYTEATDPIFQRSDLLRIGLVGEKDSATRRNQLGMLLGIGYANGKQLLNRLNGYGISREEFDAALREAGVHDE